VLGTNASLGLEESRDIVPLKVARTRKGISMESSDKSAIDVRWPSELVNVSLTHESVTRGDERRTDDEEKRMQAYALYLERRQAAGRRHRQRSEQIK
jgi:hypothetical protein